MWKVVSNWNIKEQKYVFMKVWRHILLLKVQEQILETQTLEQIHMQHVGAIRIFNTAVSQKWPAVIWSYPFLRAVK
jgi:hypothetical protein